MARVNRNRGRTSYSRTVEALVAHERNLDEVPGPVRRRVLARARAAARAGTSERSDRLEPERRAGAAPGVSGWWWTWLGPAGDWHDC